MNRYTLNTLLSVCFILMLTLSSCEAIGAIFKAGVWMGIVIIVVIIIVIFWLINKFSRK